MHATVPVPFKFRNNRITLAQEIQTNSTNRDGCSSFHRKVSFDANGQSEINAQMQRILAAAVVALRFVR